MEYPRLESAWDDVRFSGGISIIVSHAYCDGFEAFHFVWLNRKNAIEIVVAKSLKYIR